MTISAAELARIIDHTLLKPEATPAQVDALCDEAIRFGFGAVCVNPAYVSRAAARTSTGYRFAPDSHRPRIVSVAGFPLGATTTQTKVDEAKRALDEGAVEIDMVVALGALVAGDRDAVRKDIESVARVVHGASKPGILKVILETAVLSADRIVLGCRLCVEGGADFVKTSTGFHPSGGATIDHVRLLRRHASPLPVKAAGGIRTADVACAMVDAGASRIGTSAGVAIIRELGDAAA